MYTWRVLGKIWITLRNKFRGRYRVLLCKTQKGMDFGVKPFKKGLVGIEGAKARILQNPSFARETEIYAFSQLKKRFNLRCLAQQDPKYYPKRCFSEVLSGGALSCRAPPLSGTVPRTVPEIHPRRAHCVSCEPEVRKSFRAFLLIGKALETRSLSRKLRKAFLASESSRFFAHAGVLAVFGRF